MPRWEGTTDEPNAAIVDIERALTETKDLRDSFWAWLKWAKAPPFAGGVLTDWPARVADALAFAKTEWAAVQAYAEHEVSRG